MQKLSIASYLSTAGNGVKHKNVTVQVCKCISGSSDYKTKHTLYCLLNKASLLRDVQAPQQDISSSVVAKRTHIMNPLIKVRVHPSIEEAVSVMDFSILWIMFAAIRRRDEVLNRLSLIRLDTLKDVKLRFLGMFVANELHFGGQPLDKKFIEAISWHHRTADAFQKIGASIT